MAGTSQSTKLLSARFLTADIAMTDWDIAVAGMRGPAGGAAPPFKPHLALVMVRKGGPWLSAAARPYVFPPPPAAK